MKKNNPGCGCCLPCDCSLAPSNDSPYGSYSCVNGDYQAFSRVNTATFTITGTATSKGIYTSPTGTLICTGPVPDPTGSWVFDLSSYTVPVQWAYQATVETCQDATNYYYTNICLSFQIFGLSCDAGGSKSEVARLSYVTRSSSRLKTDGPLPNSDGVWRTSGEGSSCAIAGGEGSTGYRKFQLVDTTGYTIWGSQHGPYTAIGNDYNCSDACDTTICHPSCDSPTESMATDDTSTGAKTGGADMSGISVSMEYS